jgi:hypothetical protein
VVENLVDYFHLPRGDVEISNLPNRSYKRAGVEALKIRGYGPILWSVAKDQSSVVIPVRLITYARTQVACKTRNSDHFATLVDKIRKKAKEWYAEQLGTSLSIIIIKVAEMAFLEDLEVEMYTYKTLTKHKKLMKHHEALRDFNDTTPWFCGLFSWCFPKPSESYSEEWFKSPAKSSFATRSYIENRESTVVVSTATSAPLPSTTVENLHKEMCEDAKISVPDYDEVVSRDAKLHVQGPVFSEYMPIVPTLNVQNEETAVRNRCLNKTPTVQVGIFDGIRIEEYLDVDKYRSTEKVSFKCWNRTFPKARRDQHIKALADLKENPISREDFTRKSFLKVEKYMKMMLEGIEPFDFRLIQAVSHRANVALGPEMKRFSKFLTTQWNLELPVKKNHCILYASGYSNEEIGSWMEKVLDNGFPDGIWVAVLGDDMVAVVRVKGQNKFITNDFSRFDTTIGPEAIEFELQTYRKCGIEGQPMKVLEAQMHTLGYTRHGIQYSRKGGRKSGDPNTSCGNSIINGIVSMEVLKELVRKEQLAEDNIIKAYLKYGFKSKCKIASKVCDIDFCSKLFWPTASGLVLGPKPGRMLPKLGFGIRKLTKEQYRGYMKGIWQDGHFVPGVKEYTEKYDLKGVATYLVNPYTTHCTRVHEMTSETIAFFEERYGTSCESFLQGINNIRLTDPNFSSGDFMSDLIRVDG